MSFRLRCSYVPFWAEWPAVFIFKLLYRIKALHTERVPVSGGALLLANHLSYVDAAVLQLACPRPIRFVGYDRMPAQHWFFRLSYWLSGTIPISSENALLAMRQVSDALKRGELVLLFPEGSISRTGQLMQIRRGFELMAKRAGVPVIPVAHDGLWGSLFSFSERKYLFKPPRIMRTHVCVTWGNPIASPQADAAKIRQAMLDLGEEAFQERPQLKRHLGREIVRSLARQPGRVALIDRTANRKVMKAGTVLAASAALSRYLKNHVAGRRVGIVLPPSAGATIANLAVVCAGKIPVNLNFTAGRSALESSLRIGEIKTVITVDALKAKATEFPWPEDTLDLKKVLAKMGGFSAMLPWLIAAWVLPNQWFASLLGLPRYGDREEAGLLFTSGSSGEPKGVVLSHRNVLANCWQISSMAILPRYTVMLGCLPIFHSFGFTVTLWYPLLRGCRLVTVPSPLDSKRIITSIEEEQVTAMIGAPTFLRPFIKKATAGQFRSLEIVVSGAEKLPDEIYDAFLDHFHVEIMQGYGLTETSPVACVNQHNPPRPTSTAEEQQGKRRSTVGRMLPGMTARIFDPETMLPLPATEQGVVGFRGGNIFSGYLGDEEKTKACFHDGWFITGDLGRFDEDGFLRIEGRLSRFSKIGGEMVPHGTIEQRIVELFDLDLSEGYAVAIVGLPDAAKGEYLVMLTRVPFTADELRDKLTAAGLPNLWIPKVIHQVDKIPALGTGKLDLKGCRDLAIQLVGGNVQS